MSIERIDKIWKFFSKRELTYVVGHIEMGVSENIFPMVVVVKGSIICMGLSSRNMKRSLDFIYTDHPADHAASHWRIRRALDSPISQSTE